MRLAALERPPLNEGGRGVICARALARKIFFFGLMAAGLLL